MNRTESALLDDLHWALAAVEQIPGPKNCRLAEQRQSHPAAVLASEVTSNGKITRGSAANTFEDAFRSRSE